MNTVTSHFLATLTRAVLWSLRRVDYHVNKSLYSLNNPHHYQNPYIAYNALRARNPILRSYANQGWIVTGYQEVEALLRDHRIGSDIRNNRLLRQLLRSSSGGGEVPVLDNPSMLNKDPPDHTRLRKLVAQGFTRKYVQSLTPKITTLAEDLLSRTSIRNNRFDVIQALAKPLPIIVIAEMMGVPINERQQFGHLSDQLLGLFQVMRPDLMERGNTAHIAMRDYFSQLIARKRQCPGTDLISHLIRAEQDGEKLSLDELYSTCTMLLTAGHETTTRLMGNCLYLLLQNPSQLRAACTDEQCLHKAIEETLRYEPPIQLVVRFVRQSMSLRQHKLKKGQMLLLSIAGANRDPTINCDPDQFDINRNEITHLSFGSGIHLCLGMALARLETKIALQTLFSHYPNLAYAGQDPHWGTNDFFRGLETLYVTV